MNPRDVARAARRAIEIAHERVSLGEALLIFGEGSRSRSAQMQEFLPGTARYLEVQGTWILPVGITGTERLVSHGWRRLASRADHHHNRREPRISASDLRKQFDRGSRRATVDCIGNAIANLLPTSYRGASRDPHEPDTTGVVVTIVGGGAGRLKRAERRGARSAVHTEDCAAGNPPPQSATRRSQDRQ